MHTQTAILVFTRSAGEEASTKDFSNSGHRKNTLIAASLIRHTAQTVSATGLPYFIVDSSQQHGDCFGERLANAMAAVFDHGYARVIAIGNDSPDLTANMLQAAATQLETHEMVVGPSSDGGLYLIGLQRAAFDITAFAAWSWKTASLVASIRTYTQTTGFALMLLSCLVDIDKSSDLKDWLRSLQAPRFLVAYISQLIRNALIGFAEIKRRLLQVMFYREHGFRAPTR